MKFKLTLLFCFFPILILFISVRLHARTGTSIINIDSVKERLLVRSGTFFLKDEAGNMTVSDAVASDKWQPNKTGIPNFGVTRSAYWISLNLNNQSKIETFILKIPAPILDSIQLYIEAGNILRLQYSIGEATPVMNRPYNSTDFLLPLTLPSNKISRIYLRVKNGDNLQVPMILGSEKNMLREDKQKDFFWAIFIGLLASMIVYNLFLALSVNDNTYFVYVLYLIAVLLTQISIQGYTNYLFPGSKWLNEHIATLMPAFVGVSGIYFMQRFLHTRQAEPLLDKWFLPFFIAYSCSFLLVVFNQIYYGFLLAEITAASVAFYMMFVAARMSYKGDRAAKFFSVAWGIFLAGIVFYTLKDYDIFEYNNFTLYTMPVGSALESILLSFALADKINILKKEKTISQAQALREAEKNAQLIRMQNTVLETRVTERTAELTTAMSDLKNAQAQLVESEKMASLGQLTAGIAHEINNPINFVISNVKPLRRDVTMLTDVLAQVEELVGSNHSAKEVLEKIHSIKEDVEYDYLITEIDFLLKGISDGSERTAEIVKGLRIFARVDENDVKVTNIHDGLDSTIIIVNTLLSDKIAVEQDYGSVSMIECYPGKLNQAFLNIMSNGIHAIREKFGDRKGGIIKIKTWTEGEMYNISIADNGCGIPSGVGIKIFEPFYSTKEVGEGTGLGLSIAYNIIKKHEGTINYESVINEGTKFILSVPVKQS